MSSKMFYTWILCGFTAVFVIALIGNQFLLQRPVVLKSDGAAKVTESEAKQREVKDVPLADALGVNEEEMVDVGGVKRPKRDLDFVSGNVEGEGVALPDPGRAVALKGDENPQVAAYFAELKEGNVTQDAKSSLFKPLKFDRERYLKDPDSYLSQVRPGRAFQSAQPGPDVKRIVAKSKPYHRVLQGETVSLEVIGEAGMPVTFHVQSGVGELGNRLKTLTVKADESGIASVNYHATSGTLGLMDIVASSPVLSDQVNFAVKVSLPEIAMK